DTVLAVAVLLMFTATAATQALPPSLHDALPIYTAGVQLLAQGESVTDSFSYQATDGITSSNSATLVVTITGVNDAPVANDDAANIARAHLSTPVTDQSRITSSDWNTKLSVAAPG